MITYLVIAAVAFAAGIKLGESWGREQGYTRCLYDLELRDRYSGIIEAAKQSAERN